MNLFVSIRKQPTMCKENSLPAVQEYILIVHSNMAKREIILSMIEF